MKESKKLEQKSEDGDEKLHLSDVMKSVFIKAIEETYKEGIVDGMIGRGDKKIVITKILEKYCA